MKRAILTLVAGTLMGCGGVKEEKFVQDYADTFCAKVTTCDAPEDGFVFEFEDESSCKIFTTLFLSLPASQDSCEYDRKVAKDCLDELESATCADLFDPEGPGGSCAKVYGDSCEIQDTDFGFQ